MSNTYQESVERTIIAAEQLHQVVNGTATTEVLTQDGSKIPSVRKVLVDNFNFKEPLVWQQGQNETVFNQLRKTPDGLMWYAPNASVGSPVLMGATPTEATGWKIYSLDALTKLNPTVLSALKRTYGDAGLTLTDGSFEKGATAVQATDVVLQTSTGKCFNWTGVLPKVIPTNSTPEGTGGIGVGKWVDVSGSLLRSQLYEQRFVNEITPEEYGADGTANGDTDAMIKCLAVAKSTPTKITLSRMYKINKALTCYYVQTHNKSISIVGKHRYAGFELVANVPFMLDIHGYCAYVENVAFICASSVTASSSVALRICGEQPLITGIISRGNFGKTVLGVAAIRGVFSNIMHNGGNLNHGVTLQLVACVNDAVYGITSTECYAPVVFGSLPYSSETPNDLKPPSLVENITWGNEGLSCNGLRSVNTTIGLVLSGLELTASDCVVDLTLEKPLFVGGIFIKIMNSWFQPQSSFSLIDAVGYTSTIGHLSLVNCTLAGTSSATVNYNVTADYLQMTSNIIYKARCHISGSGARYLAGNIAGVDGVITKAAPDTNSVDIMTGSVKSTFARGILLGENAPDSDGKLVVRIDGDERGVEILTAAGKVLSTTRGGQGVSTVNPDNSAVLFVGSMASSGRSINAKGTVNASGADYAEYMRKSKGCPIIEKGQLCGVDCNGELTREFDLAHTFVVKSTNPSMVGGDPLADYLNTTTDATNTEQTLAFMADYDRIAFCGRVPVILDCTPIVGQWVSAVRNVDGSIGSILTKDKTNTSVGKIWTLSDGVPIIAVTV